RQRLPGAQVDRVFEEEAGLVVGVVDPGAADLAWGDQDRLEVRGSGGHVGAAGDRGGGAVRGRRRARGVHGQDADGPHVGRGRGRQVEIRAGAVGGNGGLRLRLERVAVDGDFQLEAILVVSGV